MLKDGFMFFGWWAILDAPVEPEKHSSVAVLDKNWCAWNPLPYHVQRHLNILPFPFTL
jgi:hypothetical protein